MKPRIFISAVTKELKTAVTKELKTARQLVANTLLALGFEPVWQDIFETHSGDIRPMLREKLDSCSAVLQIVGDAYGAEPPVPDEQFGRISYTQYEALYARSRGKKVYYLVAQADLPRDCPADQLDLPREDSDSGRTDSAERKKLQQSYRANIQSSEHLFYAVQTESETELTVRRLKNDLEKLRRWFQNWMLAVSAAIVLSLLGVAWVVWSQQGQAQRLGELQKQANNPERTRQQLETTILRTYEKALAEADKLTDWRKREDAKELAKSQRDANLTRVDEFLQAIVTVINSGNASPEYLEMTRIFNEQGAEEAVAYIASRKQDLLAKSRASISANRQTNLLPILEQARKQALLGRYDEARQTCEELLSEDPTWGDALHEQFWILVKLGDRALRYETVTDAEQLFEESHRFAKTLANLRDQHPQALRDLVVSHNKLGEVLLRRGQPQQALNHYDAGNKTLQTLAKADANAAQFQRDLTISYDRLGHVLLQMGQPRQALSHYDAGIQIGQKLTVTDPDDDQAQRNLSILLESSGDVLLQMGELQQALKQYEAGLQISQTRVAADPRDAQAQRDLSVSLNNIGDALLRMGQTQRALTHYEAGSKILQTLATSDLSDTRIQRDLSLSHNKLGDVLLQMGLPQQALTYYEEGHKLSQTLAAADPRDSQAQRELSLSRNNLGDVLLQLGQARQALPHYEAGLQISQALASADPRDSQAQRDLSISHNKLGDALLQLGQLQQVLPHFEAGLLIRQALALADPRDAQAQRDLSLSRNHLGDVLLRMGRHQQALVHYEAGSEILQTLATADPSDTRAKRDLSISRGRLGDVLLQLGQLQPALAHYETSLKIDQELAAVDPRDAQAQRDLIVSHYKLGNISFELCEFDTAKQSFAAGITVLDQMIDAGQLEISSKQQKSELEQKLALCNHCLIAVGDWNDLLHQPPAELPQLLTLRFAFLAKKGLQAEVLRAAEKLLSLEPKTKVIHYDAACGFALCLKLVSGWSGRGPFPPKGGVPEGTEEEQRLRKEYRTKSIAALKEAIALGWTDFEHLRKDPDLSALHGDPEFEALFPKPTAEEKPAK